MSLFQRGDPDFFDAYASGIWLYVIQTLGPNLVQAGLSGGEVRAFAAEEAYGGYVQHALRLQRHSMLTVEGRIAVLKDATLAAILSALLDATHRKRNPASGDLPAMEREGGAVERAYSDLPALLSCGAYGSFYPTLLHYAWNARRGVTTNVDRA
jgi:hypothetical protein